MCVVCVLCMLCVRYVRCLQCVTARSVRCVQCVRFVCGKCAVCAAHECGPWWCVVDVVCIVMQIVRFGGCVFMCGVQLGARLCAV